MTEHAVQLRSPTPPVKVSALEPLRLPVFRNFWLGAVVSNAGTWMQQLATPIAIYQATGRATWIGLVSISGLVPALITNVFSGTIADRFERRKVLLITQVLLGLAAVALWAIFRVEHPPLVLLCMVSAMSSLLMSLTMTSWQSFVPSLVPRALIGQAIRLNSLQFAMGRAIGPLLAAVAIRRLGTGVAFLTNGASYLAVVVVLVRLPASPPASAVSGKAMQAAKAGWRYVASYRSITLVPLTNLIVAFFGFGFLSLTSPITVNLYHQAKRSGVWLNVGFGCGGIIGMIFMSVFGERIRRSRIIPYSMCIWAGGLCCAAFAPTFGLGVLSFVIVGIAQVTVSSVFSTSLQLQVAEEFRGRAIGVYMLTMSAGVPLGSLLFGWIIDHHGPRLALLIGVSVILAVALWVSVQGIDELDAAEANGAPLPGLRWVARLRLATDPSS